MRSTDSSSPPRWRRLGAIGLGLVVSAGFVYLLLSQVELAELGSQISKVHLGILALSLLTDFASILFMGGRSYLLLNRPGDYTYRQSLKSVLLGYAGNVIFPLRAGELLRVGYLAREGGLAGRSCLAVVAFERVIDVFCVMALFLGTLSFTLVDIETSASLWGAAILVSAMVVFIVLVSRYPKPLRALLVRMTAVLGAKISGAIVDTYDKFADGLSGLSSLKSVLLVVLMSFGNWFLTAASIGIIFVAFDAQLPWYAPFVVVGFAALGNLLPSSPASVGTYHYFAALALTLFGLSQVEATSIAIVQHAVGTLPLTLVGVVWFFPELKRGISLVLGTADVSEDGEEAGGTE